MIGQGSLGPASQDAAGVVKQEAGPVVLVGMKIPRAPGELERSQTAWWWGAGKSVCPSRCWGWGGTETGSGARPSGWAHKASVRNQGEDQDVLWGRQEAAGEEQPAGGGGGDPREASEEQGRWGEASHAAPRSSDWDGCVSLCPPRQEAPAGQGRQTPSSALARGGCSGRKVFGME